MSKFFETVKEGLEDIIKYKKYKLDLRTEFVEIPKPQAKLKAKKIMTPNDLGKSAR